MLPVACIGVAGDGLGPAFFACGGWTGIGVAGEGLACGFDFVPGVEGAGVGGVTAGAAFTGPAAGEGALLCDFVLRGWLREPEGVLLPGVPYA